MRLNMRLISACLLLIAALLFSQTARAGEMLMTSGHRIVFIGKPVPVQGLTLDLIRQGVQGPVVGYPFTMLNAGPQRYYVPQTQKIVAEIQIGDPYVEQFKLDIPASPKGNMFGSVGGIISASPFSKFGRRTIKLASTGKPLEFVQEISLIRPDYVELLASKYQWKYAVGTKTLPVEVLRNTISHAIDEENHEDRLAVARFFISCEHYKPAQIELQKIAIKFPDLAGRVEELRLQIRQLQATQGLNEMKRRLDAGQYDLVYHMAKQKFPRKQINKAILLEVDQIIQKHETATEQIDQARFLLAELQTKIKDREQLQRFKDMRSVVEQRLSRHTLERITPFLKNAEDDFLSAKEKLSLAYSAWVVGPALAETDAETTIHYWDARDRILDFLRSQNPIQRKEILAQLKKIENVGPDTIAAILKHLRPVIETQPGQVGQPISLETANSSSPVPYIALLPLGYSPDRKYPLVVALHTRRMKPVKELQWWGGSNIAGPAHRNGYIVIAPDYLQNEGVKGVGSAESHRRVIAAIRDARKRFSIDSNRLFLCGHGLGGDAVFDIGMAHPDLFAGAVTITGKTNEYSKQYWENCKGLPFYVVIGELDGETFKHNSGVLSRMMKHRHDVILTEYKQRGHEDYYEELPNILQWMKYHQRTEIPKEFKMKTMRPSDNRFYWLEFSGLPEHVTKLRVNRAGKALPPTPLPIEGKVTSGNSIYVKAGAKRVTIWLTPEFVDFESRLKIRWGSRTRFNEIPEKNIAHMLEHVFVTGDRERLYWMRVDL